ncbi:DUF2157 domain-containing protein [uncultured Phenylobacterium sp.]|uniref:DUF2157 domain-containing protein n=1 Tax=uncultured Phenylobacterium sp. TaxID=349273 RepID=UPI0025FB1914|nr:DUF2157 domain-containing protein [uncultured Phenylobacterium sp.]
MASYRERLTRDLDGWIAGGLVPAESRETILDSVGEARRLDAATALAVIGGLLAGIAVIAFVAANWSGIPRIARFAMILAAFLATAGAAAWAAGRERPVASQVLLCVAAMVFAAAIGLTGQIFDIAGSPQAALGGAGLGAGLLALAAGSPWTAAVSLVFLAAGDIAAGRVFDNAPSWPGWTAYAAPLGAWLALRWSSQPLAHVAAPAVGIGAVSVAMLLPTMPEAVPWLFTVFFILLAAGARWLWQRSQAPAGILYGWWAWGAMLAFAAVGSGRLLTGAGHSIACLALSAGVVALGRHDRHRGVTALGVLALIASAARLLFDLGVGLLTSAAIFGASALVALVVSAVMQRRRRAA